MPEEVSKRLLLACIEVELRKGAAAAQMTEFETGAIVALTEHLETLASILLQCDVWLVRLAVPIRWWRRTSCTSRTSRTKHLRVSPLFFFFLLTANGEDLD